MIDKEEVLTPAELAELCRLEAIQRSLPGGPKLHMPDLGFNGAAAPDGLR